MNKPNLKVSLWEYDKDKSIEKDSRKCYDKTIYEGKSSRTFLKQIKDNYKQYQNCFIDDKIDIRKLNNIKYKQNLFEYLLNTNAECKLFLDIDKIKINLIDLKPLLNELFDCIDVICDKKFNRKKYLVFYKKLVDENNNDLNYTHSLRIINFEYKLSYIDAKKLIILLKENYKSELINGLDEKVYYYNSQICLPYNSKPYSIKYNEKLFDGKFKAEDSVNHFFIYYDFNDIKFNMKNFIEKYCISIIEDCLLLKIDKEPKIKIDALATEKNEDYINRKHYHLENNKYVLIDIVTKYVNNKFYSKKYTKIWCNFVYYFKCLNINEETIYDFLKYSCEINDDYDYDNNINYYETRINNIDRTKCYDYVYKVIADELNKLQEDYYFYVNYNEGIFKLITEWIVKRTDLNYKFVSEEMLKYTSQDLKKLEFIIITDDIKYNYKTGNLHIKNEKYCKNYFLDENKEHYKNNNYDDYDLIIDDINDLRFKKIIEDFKTGEIDNLAVEMDWGGGKSNNIGNPIITHFCDTDNNIIVDDFLKDTENYENINDNTSDFILNILFKEKDNIILNNLNNINRIIAFSPNNSLNKKEYQDIKNINNNCFISHITIKKLSEKLSKLRLARDKYDENNKEYKTINDNIKILTTLKNIYIQKINIITSIESSWKIIIEEKQTNNIQLAIYDEFNNLFNKFNEGMTTFENLPQDKTKEDVFNHFINITKTAKQHLILDADIEKHKLDYFCNVCEIKNIYKVRINGNIFNNPKIADDGTDDKYKILLCEDRKHLTNEIIKNINKKIVISTTSSKHGYYMFKLLISNMYNKKLELIDNYKNDVIGYIFGDGLYIYDCKNPNNSIIDKKIDKLDCDNFNDDNDNNCKYKLILDKFNIERLQTIKIKKIKDDFLDDYEDEIINKYKITKLIRSPTISVGISFNTRYFDLQFNFSLWGSVDCLEGLQMWFRERRTNLKEIYFCFSNHLKHYNKNLHNTENIIKRYKNNYRVANTELNKLLQINKKNIEITNVFYKWKLINEIDNENSKTNYEQIFMELLHKHSFNYDDNIFVLNNEYKKLILDDKTINDNKEVELYNLLNSDISKITTKDFQLLNNKKDDNELTNEEYLKYRKYKIFNNYIYYNAYQINNWINDLKDDFIDTLKDNIKLYNKNEYEELKRDKKLLEILNDNELMYNIINYNNYIINKYIETENHYNKYKLFDFNADFNKKYFRLKEIIFMDFDDTIEDEKNDKKTTEHIKTNKMLFYLLKFLDIDIMRDFHKDILKHYIIDNTKNNTIDSFKYDLCNNTINDVKFIDFINNELLQDYNNNSNLKKHKAININKLVVSKHLQEIITIIKFYLSKVNLYINYGSNIKNQTKTAPTLQFTIRKEYDITTKKYKIPINNLFNKIIDNDNIEIYEKQINYKYHNIMDTIINEDFCNETKNNNKKFIDINNISPNSIKKAENNYIEKYKTDNNIIPTIKTIYKDIKEDEVIEDVYGNKIIMKPINNIKKAFGNKYYDEDKKQLLKSELYMNYNVNTRKDILNYLNNINVTKNNFMDLINKKVKVYINNKDDYDKVNVKNEMVINNGKVKLNLITIKKAVKKRRYTTEVYDVNKRDKLLNFINIEIKQPIKKLNDNDDIIKIKYDNVIKELIRGKTTPILIKDKDIYINNFLDNLIEVY